ncbi:MAG: hypothetical protein JSS11_09050 [Verrucomicrobia bacterium]|nr:hypothetical protein [Verrucomicrobiota bacterium]
MALEIASARAYAQDLRAIPEQAEVTRTRLLPAIDAILALLAGHRAAIDRAMAARRAALPPGIRPEIGEPSLATYPVGFCRHIRDQVWDRALADPAFQALLGRDVILKKVFILLKGRYFQNAVQLGNLYIDVANDTVWTDKPKLEWQPIAEVDYTNVDDWPTFAAVARRYLHVELYPNLLFPFAFPAAPFFAIRPGGRIDLFFAQDIIFLKDVGQGMRRILQLLSDDALMARRLPPAYEALVRQACSPNLHDVFPLEFAPAPPAAIRDGVVAEFIALRQQPPDRALAMVEQYATLLADATRRLMRMNLVPPADELARLRATGAIPAEHPDAPES